MEPVVALSEHVGLGTTQLNEIQSIVEKHNDEFRNVWRQHFGI